MKIISHTCSPNEVLPLCPASKLSLPSHSYVGSVLPLLPIGTVLYCEEQALFTVVGRMLWTTCEEHATYFPLLKAHENIISAQELSVQPQRQGFALAWITLSDKGSQGKRQDKSGPLIAETLRPALPLCHEQGFLLPDDAQALQSLILELAFGQDYHIIVTTGGTGIGPRDVTPHAMEKILDTRLTGFEQMMMQASLQKTPHAALSRAMVGLVGRCLCINLPGSVKAVGENLEAILAALPHALDKIHVEGVDCGG